MNGRSGGSKEWLWAASIALVCHTAWYGADALQGGFRNLDVGGIAYNARLLLAGDLPYVDSWEFKPPGAFFLFAPLLAFGSMHTVWVTAILWGTATSLSVGLLAGRLWGRRYALPAVALHAGGTLLPTQADINYVFWATLPYVLAAAMAFKPREDVRRPWLHWMLVGAVAAVAVLVKQPMGGLIFVLPLAVWVRAGPRLSQKLHATAWGTLGAASIFLLVALPWLFAGELPALAAGLGLAGGWWVDYTAAQSEPLGGTLAALGRGALFIPNVIQLGSAAALLGLLGWPRRNRPTWPYWAALVFLLASFAGMAVTLRFYLHYLGQLWPALVVMALNPAGLFVRLLDRLAAFGVRPAFICLLVATSGILLRQDLLQKRRIERALKDQEVAALCAELEPHLDPAETVLAWGWPSWGVYTHCDRRAPGPIYKAMTLVTTPNTNTGWRRSDPMVFRPGPAAERFVSDFLVARPALFLWSNGFAAYGNEPLVDLPEVVSLLDDEYLGLALQGKYVAFVRRDVYEKVRDGTLGIKPIVDFEEVLRMYGVPPREPAAPDSHDTTLPMPGE